MFGINNGINGFKEGLQNLTSPIGSVRKGLFDFAGAPKQGTDAQGNTMYGMSQSGRQNAMAGIQQGSMRGSMQGGNFSNPQANQQVLGIYNQMMQAIRQKRGI